MNFYKNYVMYLIYTTSQIIVYLKLSTENSSNSKFIHFCDQILQCFSSLLHFLYVIKINY